MLCFLGSVVILGVPIVNVGVDLQTLSRAMSCSVAKASLRYTVQSVAGLPSSTAGSLQMPAV